MAKLGQTQALKDQAKGKGFTDIVNLEEGENVWRILYGPVRVDQIYYPTLVKDKESEQLKQGFRVIKRDPVQGCVLDPIASLEKKLRAAMGEEKPKSTFEAKSKWLYLIIDRKTGQIAIGAVPYSVYKKIVEIEEKASAKDPNKLRYGLIFMYDLIITKSVTKGVSRQFGTKYEVEVDTENPMAGKVPISYLGRSSDELMSRGIDLQSYFTPEEWEAIEASDLDVEKEGRPNTAAEVDSLLAEFPVYLGALEQDGSPKFPQPAKLAEAMEKLSLQFNLTQAGQARAQIPAGRRFADMTEVEEVEGADFVVEEQAPFDVEEEVKPTPAPAKPKAQPAPEPEEITVDDELDEFQEPPAPKPKAAATTVNRAKVSQDELPDW